MTHDALAESGAGLDYVPPVDDLTQPWWDATRDHRLVLQTCSACGWRQHHPRYVCGSCGSRAGHGWTEASGGAVIDTFTIVHKAPRPDLPLPYVVARVRLTEGPVLLTNIIDRGLGDGSGEHPMHIGMVVYLHWRDLADGRSLPVFSSREST